MVHVLVYGMPKLSPKKLTACDEAIRKAVANHAITGGSHNVEVQFVQTQQAGSVIFAQVHGLEIGCHRVPKPDEKTELCCAVFDALVAAKTKRKKIEVFTVPIANPEFEGSAV